MAQKRNPLQQAEQVVNLLSRSTQSRDIDESRICVMMQEYVDHLPRDVAQDPSQLGAWLYSCGECSHEEEAAVNGSITFLPLQVCTLDVTSQ